MNQNDKNKEKILNKMSKFYFVRIKFLIPLGSFKTFFLFYTIINKNVEMDKPQVQLFIFF